MQIADEVLRNNPAEPGQGNQVDEADVKYQIQDGLENSSLDIRCIRSRVVQHFCFRKTMFRTAGCTETDHVAAARAIHQSTAVPGASRQNARNRSICSTNLFRSQFLPAYVSNASSDSGAGVRDGLKRFMILARPNNTGTWEQSLIPTRFLDFLPVVSSAGQYI